MKGSTFKRSKSKHLLPGATATTALPMESPIRDVFPVTLTNVIEDPQSDLSVSPRGTAVRRMPEGYLSPPSGAGRAHNPLLCFRDLGILSYLSGHFVRPLIRNRGWIVDDPVVTLQSPLIDSSAYRPSFPSIGSPHNNPRISQMLESLSEFGCEP